MSTLTAIALDTTDTAPIHRVVDLGRRAADRHNATDFAEALARLTQAPAEDRDRLTADLMDVVDRWLDHTAIRTATLAEYLASRAAAGAVTS